MCSLEKRGNVYILTLTGTGEHRLNPALIDSIHEALQKLRSDPPSVLITTSHGKFFSNGFDLAWAQPSRSRLLLMSSKFQSLISEFISLPMPTIAAVTGHASAAGMILALSHDYVVMRKDKGFLYMSEVDLGLVIPDWFVAMLKCKIGDPNVQREVVLTAAKLTAEMGLERGIVDSAHDGAVETVEAAVRLGEELVKRQWNCEGYGKNRVVMLREVLEKMEISATKEMDRNKVSKL